MKLTIPAVLCCLAACSASGQESRLGADFRGEGERFKKSCTKFSFASLAGCTQVLFTDHPLHIAVGSLAPQNGFAAGPALVTHWTPNESWRLNWDADAVASSNGSWRAGMYMTAVLTRKRQIVVTPGTVPAPTGRSRVTVRQYPVFHAYAQGISLNKIGFFGLGPNTSDTARSWFGMRETIVGANVIWPVLPKLNLSLYAEANGRFVDIRPSTGNSSPSIEQRYSEFSVPGLARQPSFAQFGQGIRLRPNLAGDYIRLNYFVTFKEYVASDSVYSFQRFTADLQHQFPLYRQTRTYQPRDHNPPDDCSLDPQINGCPSVTRNLEGSFNLRFYMSESFTSAGHVVPFYFQPTLGGSDINGVPWLPSYQDYRFRAPNLIVARASFEHSIYGPLGISLMVDEGKVVLRRGDLDFTHLRHSYAAGLTIRAGGFPQVWLLFAWGGREGTHTISTINTSLLGGGVRPLLQ